MSPTKEMQAELDLTLPNGRKMPIVGYGTFLVRFILYSFLTRKKLYLY